MRKIYVNNKDITASVGDLSWSSDVDTLGVQLDFSVAYVLNEKKPNKEIVNLGDIVVMKNNGKRIFTGLVVTIDRDGYQPRKVTCMDFAFHLNKSQVVIQFNKSAADEAIKRLLSRFGNIKSSIVKIPTKITKIYKGEEVSEIIKDILETVTKRTGTKYRLEMRDNVLVIEKQTNLVVKAKTNYIMNPKRTLSIQDMKNSIQVVSNDEKATKILASVKDSKSIKKYGLLQMVEEISKEEAKQAKSIANQAFKEYNKIFEDNSVELIGDDSVRAGRILKIKEPITGMSGNYLIKNVAHKVSGGIHLMTVTLEVM